MSRKVHLVVLSRFPDIFDGFKDSIDRDAPGLSKICVWDGDYERPKPDGQWMFIDGTKEFRIARNANLGWRAVPRDSDIIYCGDDVRICEPETVERLQEIAYANPLFGITSPEIHGPFNAENNNWCAFVFVYLKRETIEKVGFLDENFDGYGLEDLDYCLRVKRAGLKIWVTSSVHVKHHGLATFRRIYGEDDITRHDRTNRERFGRKWSCGSDPTSIYETIRRSEITARL